MELAGISYDARRAFNTFVHHANRGLLHDYDWDRYYDFILVCHLVRERLSSEDLRSALVGLFPEHVAERLAVVYDHGRELLQYSTPVFRRRRIDWDGVRKSSEAPDYWGEGISHQGGRGSWASNT